MNEVLQVLFILHEAVLFCTRKVTYFSIILMMVKICCTTLFYHCNFYSRAGPEILEARWELKNGALIDLLLLQVEVM